MIGNNEFDTLVRLGQRGFLLEGTRNDSSYLFYVGVNLSGGAKRSTILRRWKNDVSVYASSFIEMTGLTDTIDPDEDDSDWTKTVPWELMECPPPISSEHIGEFLDLDSAHWLLPEKDIQDRLQRYRGVSSADREWIYEATRGEYRVVGVSHVLFEESHRTAVAIADVSQRSVGWSWSPLGFTVRSMKYDLFSPVFYNFFLKERPSSTENYTDLTYLNELVRKLPEESRVEWLKRMQMSFDVVDAGEIINATQFYPGARRTHTRKT